MKHWHRERPPPGAICRAPSDVIRRLSPAHLRWSITNAGVCDQVTRSASPIRRCYWSLLEYLSPYYLRSCLEEVGHSKLRSDQERIWFRLNIVNNPAFSRFGNVHLSHDLWSFKDYISILLVQWIFQYGWIKWCFKNGFPGQNNRKIAAEPKRKFLH